MCFLDDGKGFFGFVLFIYFLSQIIYFLRQINNFLASFVALQSWQKIKKKSNKLKSYF